MIDSEPPEPDRAGTPRSPLHTGERQVHERLGLRKPEQVARRLVRDHLPEQHREFYAALPFIVVAARDDLGRPWITLLTGPPGFASSPDPRRLLIRSSIAPGDALAAALGVGDDIGVLGIELSTRRRNRVNGRVTWTERIANSERLIDVAVAQTFGNCPKYIHVREVGLVRGTPQPVAKNASELSARQVAWITAADTFFIGSGYRGVGCDPAYGMDASHRGGEPGFVRATDPRSLAFPDYPGNNLFNTIGNLVLDPRVGLTFVDLRSGSLLQITGRARIDWDAEQAADAYRLVRVEIDAVVEVSHAVPLRSCS